LKYASIQHSKLGETIAISNLGAIGYKNFEQSNNESNKIYIQKYKAFGEQIGDKKSKEITLQ